MTSPYSCILWDMDGTIVDASEGILKRLDITHKHFGLVSPQRDDLVHWIGPPLFDSFQNQAGMTPEQASEAVAYYRGLTGPTGEATGTRVFDGVSELIVDVASAGIPQSIASSKPETQVVHLLEHFDLTKYFDAAVGSTPDERTLAKKGDIVREALRRLEEKGVDVSRPVLIGDRHHDVDGGNEHGVPVIFVTWGFSNPEEANGSFAVATTSAELRELLLPAS